METFATERPLSGYRIRLIVRERLKVLAKTKKVSVSDLVDSTLFELTKDVRTPEEIKEENTRTEKFLNACIGKWKDPEYDECVKAINNCRVINEPV